MGGGTVMCWFLIKWWFFPRMLCDFIVRCMYDALSIYYDFLLSSCGSLIYLDVYLLTWVFVPLALGFMLFRQSSFHIETVREAPSDEGSRWDKTKKFLYDYRWHIAVGVLLVGVIALAWNVPSSSPAPQLPDWYIQTRNTLDYCTRQVCEAQELCNEGELKNALRKALDAHIKFLKLTEELERQGHTGAVKDSCMDVGRMIDSTIVRINKQI